MIEHESMEGMIKSYEEELARESRKIKMGLYAVLFCVVALMTVMVMGIPNTNDKEPVQAINEQGL